MLEHSEDGQSQASGFGQTTERLRLMLSEQVQVNEKLEVENEKKSIQIRKLLNLLKSKRFLTPGKEQKITQLQETTKTTTETSQLETHTTIEAEDRMAALSDYIKFKAFDGLMVRFTARRLAQAMTAMGLHPYQVREWTVRRRGPQVKASEAHFLFLLTRLVRSVSLKAKLRGFNGVRRAALSDREFQRRTELSKARAGLFYGKLGIVAKVLEKKKTESSIAFLERLKLAAFENAYREDIRAQRQIIGVLSVGRVVSKLESRRKVEVFSSLCSTFASRLRSESKQLSSMMDDQRRSIDRQRQDLGNQETVVLSLKAEISKLKSTQATTNLELQKSQAKAKILETGKMALVARCESLATSVGKLKEEKAHLEQLAERIRDQYCSLQQDYEERIEAFNQATEDVSKASAKNQVEKAALNERIQALLDQREEDKVALYKAGNAQ